MSENDRRYETKFPMGYEQLRAFEYWRRDRGCQFESAFPERVVNNLYFETHDWWAVADNKDGVSRRSKARLRWYGETVGPADCQLEVKYRASVTGSKQRMNVAVNPQWFDRLSSLPDRLRPLLDPALRLSLGPYRAVVLFNRYRRAYFSTRDGIRMTVDTRLQFADPSTGALEKCRFVDSTVPVVVELKYPPALRTLAMQYLSEFPVRPSRCSKYVIGVEHLYC